MTKYESVEFVPVAFLYAGDKKSCFGLGERLGSCFVWMSVLLLMKRG